MRAFREHQNAVSGRPADLDAGYALAHHDRRVRHQLPDDHAHHGAAGTARHHRSVLQHHRDAGIARRPDRPGTDEDTAVLVGNCRGVVNGVADRCRSVDGGAKSNPRRTDVANRLVRFCCADNAVGIERGEYRNERRSGRCSHGNELRRVLYPLRSFLCGFDDLFH